MKTILLNGLELNQSPIKCLSFRSDPWYIILDIREGHDDYIEGATRVRAEDTDGQVVEFSIDNDSDALKELLKCDPFRDNKLSINCRT